MSIFEECPQFTNIRSLTREELSWDWVFDELIEVWNMVLKSLRVPETHQLSVGHSLSSDPGLC